MIISWICPAMVHPPVAVADRTAQFSPFAALTDHEAAIRETARLTDRKIKRDRI